MSEQTQPEQSDSLTAWNILRAHGIDWPTQADQRAYADVLDRMGAFSLTERTVLIEAGYLGVRRS